MTCNYAVGSRCVVRREPTACETCLDSGSDPAGRWWLVERNEPAVDTEAAAVWERLSKRARKDLCELVHYQAGGAMSFRARNLAPLQRADVVDVNGWPNDLGRRVASYGAAVLAEHRAEVMR